jgi:hypothetical protein
MSAAVQPNSALSAAQVRRAQHAPAGRDRRDGAPGEHRVGQVSPDALQHRVAQVPSDGSESRVVQFWSLKIAAAAVALARLADQPTVTAPSPAHAPPSSWPTCSRC